jgi:hypothetical protein
MKSLRPTIWNGSPWTASSTCCGYRAPPPLEACHLVVSRQAALETALLRTHPSTLPNGPYRIKISREEALEWRTNPKKRAVLEARLAEAGYDADALNAGAFIEAQVPLATIDRFLCSARGQLNATLKEIGVRREFAERARKAFDERLKLTVEVSKPAQIGPN